MAQGIFYDGSTGNLIITASRVDISGSLSIQGVSNVSSSIASGGGGGGGSTDTGSLMVTASVSSNTITFTKGDSSTFNITVDTGSGGGGGGSQNLQQVLDTGNTATQDIDLTGHIDADEYKLFGNTIITGSGQVNNVSIGDGVGIGGNKLVAIGKDAYQSGGNDFSTVIGFHAGRNVPSTTSALTAVGGQTGLNHTGSQSVLIGAYAGQNSHTDRALIMGVLAGENVRESDVVLLGYNAGQNLYNGTATLAIGFKAGQFSSGSNTLIGGSAGIRNKGTNNVFIGQAGTNNTGDSNVAFGYAAAERNTGDSNTAFGFRSLRDNTGNGNISYNGCGQNNTGNNNLFFGTAHNNSGNGNVFLGFDSYNIGLNNSGDRNLAFGSRNLQNNSGNDNIALGVSNLEYNGTGARNVAIGHGAGRGSYSTTFTGQNNIFIGYLSGYGNAGNGSTLTHATAIGAQATVEQNYAIVLGQVNNYNTKVGIGTTTPSTRLHIVGNTTTNAQSSLLVEDSGGTELFKVRNDGVVSIEQLRIANSFTPSSTSDTTGDTGDIAWDDSYIYVRTSAGWKRAALSTF